MEKSLINDYETGINYQRMMVTTVERLWTISKPRELNVA